MRATAKTFPWALAGLAMLAAGSLAGASPLSKVTRPGTVHKNDPKIELGRRLFFDPLASQSGLKACAACHDPGHGFSDPEVVSRDGVGLSARHSQTILDADQNPSAHWDGEFRSVQELCERRLGPPPVTV